MRNTLDPGTMLRQYRIDEVIGQGGFGITYLAVDTDLNRKVAIKECYPRDFVSRDGTTVIPTSSEDAVDFEWALKKFVDEATTLARFRHEGIVQVLQIIKDQNNSAYMILEFVDGQSFDAWLKSLGRLPTEDELLAVVHPLVAALEVVHANDIAHRDIAPDNIYIKPDGHAVLLDFGAAKATVGKYSRTLNLVVKDGYSAPEQYYAEGRQGPWTDIYALAATLYRAVTGKRPIDSMARLDAFNNGEPDPLTPASKLGLKGYSDAFLNTIDKGLVPPMKDRPKTVAEWAAGFPARRGTIPASSVEPTQLFRPSNENSSRQKKAHNTTPRSKAPLIAVAVGAALLLVGGGYYYYWSAEQENARQQAAWKEASLNDSRKDYQAFLAAFPHSPFKHDAEGAIAALDRPWQKSIPATGASAGTAIITDADSVFVAGFVAEDGSRSTMLRRFSHGGKLIWEKQGSKNGRVNALVATGDGGVLAIGETGTGTNTDGLAISFDADGTIRWEKTFGGNGIDRLADGAALEGGDFLLVGSSPARGRGQQEGWVLRLDANGGMKSEERIGGNGDDALNAIVVTGGGQMVMAGSSSEVPGESSNFWLIRRSRDGALIVDRKPGGAESDTVNALAADSKGNAVMVGDTLSFGTKTSDGMILQLSYDNKMKPNIIAEAGQDHLNDVVMLSDGSIVVAGATSSKSKRGMDGWIIRYSPDLSTRLWERVIGTDGEDRVNGLSASDDGGIFFTGESEASNGKISQMWVGKLTKNGNGAE